MKGWISGIGKGLSSLFRGEDDPAVETRRHRERVVTRGLERLKSAAPERSAIEAVLSKQSEIDAIHRRLTDESAVGEIAEEIQFDGLSRLKPLQEAGKGYLLVYVQGFLTGLLQQMAQEPKPVVSVVFRLHEDASAHIPVLERGHGLAFELPFFPQEGSAQLTDFLGELTAVSSKGAAFAVETGVPVLPVWCRVDDEGLTLEIGEAMSGDGSVTRLTSALVEHFARRIHASPAEMDWEADCWYPPVNRLLPSRFDWELALSAEQSVEGLAPFRVLVRVPDDVREACLAVPAVRAIKRGRPDVYLTVLTTASMEPFWNLVNACDGFARVGEASEGDGSFALGVVINQESAALAELQAFNVARTTGMESHPVSDKFDDLLNMPRKLGPPEHRHRSYLRVAHRLGAQVVDDVTLRVPMKRGCADAGLKVVGMAPESEIGTSYVWPRERFEEVIRMSPDSLQWRVWVSAEGREAWLPLQSELGENRVVLELEVGDVEGKLAALDRVGMLLSNDNEWVHLASTVYGLPTIAIYGPSEPIETGPLSSKALILRQHVECTPCFLAECPLDHRCLNEIEVDDVMAALESHLGISE